MILSIKYRLTIIIINLVMHLHLYDINNNINSSITHAADEPFSYNILCYSHTDHSCSLLCIYDLISDVLQ